MKKKEINIIGCGWLGKLLGTSLASNGFRVYGSSTGKDKLKQLASFGITPYLLELGNQSSELKSQIPNASVSIILLTPRILQANLSELTTILHRYEPDHIILASSTAVYPSVNSQVREEDAIHRTSPHSGTDMLWIEEEVSRQFPATILRFAGLYGPGRHPGNFLAGKSGLSGAENPVNLVHSDDCIAAITEVVNNPVQGVFNICADRHPPRKEFYTLASMDLGKEPPYFGAGDATFKIVSNIKFKDAFGFTYLHPDPALDFL